MKRAVQLLKFIGLVALSTQFSHCSKDASISNVQSQSFVYDMDDLYGIWNSSEIFDEESAQWCSIESGLSGYEMFSFSIRFKEDYTYLYDGYTYDEEGTYTTNGSIVTTYINSVLQAEYDIISLEDGEMSLTIIKGTKAVDYKLVNRWSSSN